MIDVNIKGVMYGIAAALSAHAAAEGGSLHQRLVRRGPRVGPGFAVCAAAEYAVRALSEGLRQEVKPYNIRTTVISPGAVATELPNTITELRLSAFAHSMTRWLFLPAPSRAPSRLR
jgi:NADP-dependent 3-hydroxy acid dehydrogenase YdfG